MRRLFGLAGFVLTLALAPIVTYSAADYPGWAFGFSTPPPTGPAPAAERPRRERPPADKIFTLPGSDKQYKIVCTPRPIRKKATQVSLSSGKTQRIRMTSTADADVLS